MRGGPRASAQPKLRGVGYDLEVEDGDANLMELAQRCTLSPVLMRMWIEAATVMLFKFHRAPPPRTRLSLSPGVAVVVHLEAAHIVARGT